MTNEAGATAVLSIDAATSHVVGHINLARGFRGGERQTLLLVRELAKHDIRQIAVVRAGEELSQRLGGIPGLELRTVGSGFLAAFRATTDAGLWHAHEGRGVHVASARHRISKTSYLITRRVLNPPTASFLTRYTYRNARVIAVISRAIEDVMKTYTGSRATVVIPSAGGQFTSNPVRVEKMRESFPGKFIVGHVGALDNSTKGQTFIIRVARELQQSHPKLQFILVGAGKDETMLRDEAKGLSNVTFTGFVNNVGDFLALFDIFVFPSLHEGLGSTLVDAMDFSLPIVASRVGGIPDLIQDDETGILIDSSDTDGLRDAVIALYEDPQKSSQLAAAAKKRAAEFSVEQMVDGYLTVYRDILSSES